MEQLPNHVCVKREKPLEIVDEDFDIHSLLEEYVPLHISPEPEIIVISSEDEEEDSDLESDSGEDENEDEDEDEDENHNEVVGVVEDEDDNEVVGVVEDKVMSVHTRIKEFLCVFCNKKLARKDSFKNHLLIHARERSTKKPPQQPKSICNFCDKELASKTSLKRHLLIHTRESSKKISTIKTVQNHRKKHRCPTCGIIIKSSEANLIRHMQLHSTERAFKCDLCDYSANRKDYCQKHFERAHQNI